MLNRPDRADLLEAVAAFLEGELKGAVGDPRLAFRVLIAASLCRSVAEESRRGELDEHAELERLRALLPGKLTERAINQSIGPEARRALIMEKDQALIDRIRDKGTSPAQRQAITDHVKTTLRAELSITNPRFDLSAEIE